MMLGNSASCFVLRRDIPGKERGEKNSLTTTAQPIVDYFGVHLLI